MGWMPQKIVSPVILATMMLAPFSCGHAQQGWLAVRMAGSLQTQSQKFKAERAVGIGSSLQMLFAMAKSLHVRVGVGYEYSWLRQKDVLDEWQWDYWEKTYIDFLPGAKAQHVNQTLHYTSADGIYSATFRPSQQLKELRLHIGLDRTLALGQRLAFVGGCTFGADLFYRELEMREDWTKRFNLDTTSVDLDYAFHYRLLHFAPTRTGVSYYVAPMAALQVTVSSSIDLDGEVTYVHYFRRDRLLGIRLAEAGSKWLPLKGKVVAAIGLTFKY
ncbi:MAG: hypothetical protein ACUVWA_05140 [Candidatus Oleimicrobiaceae bacterium]